MTALSTFYCHGYVTTPLVEACQQRGLFTLLDRREFRDRAWLIAELRANAGCFTIALEELVSAGWLAKSRDDAFRLTSRADGHRERGLTPLYAVAPERLIAEDPHAQTLREKIEQLFPGPEVDGSASPDPARGSIIVPLVVALHGMDAESLGRELDRLDRGLSRAISELFIHQGWLAADRAALTASGRALLQGRAFGVAASYRPVLHGIGDLLFGDRARARHEGGHATRFVIQQEIVGGLNREPLDLRDFTDHLVTVDARQPAEAALSVLAAEQPVGYLDHEGRLVDAVTVLSRRRQQLRAVAQSIHDSRLLILEAHAAPGHLIDQPPDDVGFVHCDWIDRLAQEYPISAEAFITLAASVGLFNDEDVRRYPRTSEPCRMSVHGLIRRDYIVRHAMLDDLERLAELEKLCWQHTRTPKKGARGDLHPADRDAGRAGDVHGCRCPRTASIIRPDHPVAGGQYRSSSAGRELR
jgi:hypothetical protein